jgi:hypothetical protein
MRGVDVAVKKLFKTEYNDDLIHDFVHEVRVVRACVCVFVCVLVLLKSCCCCC